MRKPFEKQYKADEIPIAEIKIDLKSRDEIPRLLLGLQAIFIATNIRDQILEHIAGLFPQDTLKKKGREGMSYWEILVLGMLRLICNWDYDKLMEIANNHNTLRLMLGLSPLIDGEKRYGLQTLKDNISKFTPEVLSKINHIVVEFGHDFIGVTEDKILARCDSSVTETNVHYPTDINLLFDAMRKVITLTAQACCYLGITGWRQSDHNIRMVKKRYRKAQKLKHSTSQDPKKKEERKKIVREAHQNYIDVSRGFLEKVKKTCDKFGCKDPFLNHLMEEIERFRKHALRQIDQIERRVIKGETIPHDEKVFSLFEDHTEWITKGKAGVSQQLGHRVSIVEDQYGFILNHRIMLKETDEKIAVPLIQETKKLYPSLASCSFDKGFYTPDNRTELKKYLELVVMPKKGRLSRKDKEIEGGGDFVQARKQHPAVESAFASLQNHSLDRCPDRGLIGFKRYIGLAVLARNIEKLGGYIQKKWVKQKKRKKKYNETYLSNRNAA